MQVKGKKILHAITLSSVGGAQSVVVNLANFQCENNEVNKLSTDYNNCFVEIGNGKP